MPAPWFQHPSDPARAAASVTPSDAADLPVAPTRALYVGTTGDLTVVMQSGQTVTFASVPVGVLPVCVKRVRATGTTATDLIALY